MSAPPGRLLRTLDGEEPPMTDQPADTPRILGTLHAVDGVGLVRIEGTTAAAPDAVWAALTEPDRLADWLGTVEGDLREGGEYRGRWRVSEWEGSGRIRTCEPPRRLVLSAAEADQEQEHLTTITIAADGEGSRVVVEERGMPLPMVAAYGAGTQIHVEDLLAHVGGSAERHTAERFGALYPSYQAQPVLEG
jgi:uncharacterized protein YndB with AHSA1/START domain